MPAIPLEITAGVDFGYDDHVIGSNAAANSSGQSSFFAKENLVLTYDRPGEQTEVSLLAVGRFTQYFDVGTDDKDGTSLRRLRITSRHGFPSTPTFTALIRPSLISNPTLVPQTCALLTSTRPIFFRLPIIGSHGYPV